MWGGRGGGLGGRRRVNFIEGQESRVAAAVAAAAAAEEWRRCEQASVSDNTYLERGSRRLQRND